MKYDSIFDVMGNIMVGPSSSHTAGACRIGYIAHRIFGKIPEIARVYLHGSFAETYRGHRSDVAIIAGLLGMPQFDERIPKSFSLAEEAGLSFSFIMRDLGPNYHPNSIMIEMIKGAEKMTIVGSSIGGGKISIKEIDGMEAGFDGDSPTIIERHIDKAGVLAKITSVISIFGLKVTEMHLSRNIRKGIALSWIEIEDPIPQDLIDMIGKIPEILGVRMLDV